MIKLMFNRPIAANILEQAVSDVIKTVALEETALSNILNLENEIIQKAKTSPANLEEFVTINESVNRIIKNVTEVQATTQISLQNLKELIQKLENPNEIGAQDEKS